MFKKLTLGSTLALFLSATQPNAEEDCVFKRAMEYTSQTDFRANQIYTTEQASPQLDTNATLFRRGQRGTLIPELARSFEVDDDRKKLIIHLNNQCGWSDGNPVTASQIKHGIELTFLERRDDYLSGRKMIKHGQDVLKGEKDLSSLGIRAIDDLTLEFDLIVPAELLLAALTYPSFTPAPLHIMKDNPLAWPTPSLIRESSGPFKAVSLTDRQINLVQNPYYCRDIPIYPKQVIIKQNEIVTKNIKIFFDKEIDITRLPTFEPETLESIRNAGFHDFETLSRHEELVGSLTISRMHEWAQDERLRRAMALVIDYAAVDRVVNPGKKTHNYPRQFTSKYDGYQVFPTAIQLRPYSERLAEAKDLMKAAGYGPKNRLKLEILYRGGYPDQSLTHVLIAMFQQIYVDIEIDSILDDGRKYYTEINNNRYDIAIKIWRSDYADPSNFIGGILKPHLIPEEHLKGLRADLNASNHILDQKKRYEKLAEIERAAMALNYAIPLFELETTWLIHAGFSLGSEFPLTGRNVIIDGCSGY